MYYSPINILVVLILILRSLIAISSRNWFFVWFSIELNILIFIPILLFNNNIIEIEGSIKYLITQSIASSILLISSIIIWNIILNTYLLNYILLISLLIKLGSFPAYFWFPSVISSIRWINCIILSTWQKLIPIFLLFSIVNVNNKIIITICLSNILIGGIFGIKTSNIKTIIAYSSISHLGWILIIKIINIVSILYFYFVSYCLMIIPLFYFLNNLKINNFSNINIINKTNITRIITLSLIILSLAGLPPFTGFFLKIIVIFLIININIIYMIIIIILSILSLYFYLNIVYNLLLNSYINNDTNVKYRYKKTLNILSIFIYTPIIILLYAMTLLN